MKKDKRKVRSDKVSFLFYQSLAVYFLLCCHKLASYLFFEISSFFSLISFVLSLHSALMRFKLCDHYFLSLSLSLPVALFLYCQSLYTHTTTHTTTHFTQRIHRGTFSSHIKNRND